MTKFEYNDLYDRLVYGHDADLCVENQRFFIEWNKEGITIYQMMVDTGSKVAVLQGDDKTEVVKELFDYPLIHGKCLNNSYQEVSILDIE